MAAGIGSRYGGLKQIDPIGPSGEIILDYSVYDAMQAGFEKVVFIIRREIEEAFRETLGTRFEKRIETAYAFQELSMLPEGFSLPEDRKKPWGTGHAVLCARQAVNGPCTVINADDFYGADSFKKMGDYLNTATDRDGKYDYSMVGFYLGNTISEHGHVARGVCQVSDDGFLEGIQERTRIEKRGDEIQFTEDDGATWTTLPESTVVSMNMWGFTVSLFPELEARFVEFLKANMQKPKAEYFIPTVVAQLLAEGKATARVIPTSARWVGVTYKEDLPGVKQAIRDLVDQGAYPGNLWGT